MIGSANSSNTRALERLARESGAVTVVRVNGPDELPSDLTRHRRRHRRGLGARGAGARPSSPGSHPPTGVEEVRITEEDEYFPPPRELRDLLTAVDVLATFSLGGSVPDRPVLRDRDLAASDVLAQLT